MFAQRPIILFGKWKGDATGQFVLTGRNGLGDFSSSLDVAGVQPDEGNRALRYLWARSRIAELSDYGDGEMPRNRIREITDLGLKYNLLTQYTSFIAVRQKVVNPNGDASDVEQPLPLPVGVMDTAIGAEPELWWLLAALLVAGSIYKLRGRLRPVDALLKWAE
jgi:Ca-activated chloride channel family protein